MKDMRSALLFILAVSPCALLVLHMITIRACAFFRMRVSNQKIAMMAILVMNIPVAAALFLAGSKRALDYCYLLAVYNGIGYCYFHFFNMSETARRIKILVKTARGVLRTTKDMAKHYDHRAALSNRIEQLKDLGQVRETPRGYVLSGKQLYIVSHCIHLFRRILGFH